MASFCADAAALTKRIRDEALEEGDFPNLFKAAEGTKRVDAAVAEIEWDEPPASVRDAAAAYMKVAERKPSVLLKALLWGLGALVIAGAFGWLLGGPFGALAAGAFGFLGGYGISRPLIADQYLFEGSLSVDWTGIQAFNREYARSRGLERQKIFQFHHDYRGLPVPGKADSVQAGEVPVAGVPGLFVMLSDSPELRASGRPWMTPDRRASRLLRRARRRPLPRARTRRGRGPRSTRGLLGRADGRAHGRRRLAGRSPAT